MDIQGKQPFLELRNINKSFSGNKVLNNFSIVLNRGEIHSVVGENGAGKSTLMKIIGGIYAADSGEIYKNGERIEINNPNDAFRHGIGLIHQELSIFDSVSAAHNVFVNREPTRFLGFVNWKKMNADAVAEFDKVGLKIKALEKAEKFSVGIQQTIEIVKALSVNAELLIMDEPTSALSSQETDILFDLLFSLRDKGTTIIFISHKLSEVLALSERITILRDGNYMGTLERKDATVSQIISMMVGRTIDQLYPPKAVSREGEIIFEAKGLSRTGQFSDVNFSLRKGEILGLFGLVGSGRTELAHTLIGAQKGDSGEIYLENKKVQFRSPRQAVKAGVCYLTEDRRHQGLFLTMSVTENIASSSMDMVSDQYGFINQKKASDLSDKYINLLDVVPRDSDKKTFEFSGGNQQKILLGKWLATEPKVLIVDEPTRGVDVGAKAKIHFMLRDLANQGVAILLISSELPEILGISDRIMVMHEGYQKAILENEDGITEKKIMQKAFSERA